MSGCITSGRRAGFCPPKASRMDVDFGGAQELLDEFLFFSVGIDGIIVDRNVATDLSYPCRCTTITKSDGQEEPYCFKKGVVGTLRQDQVRELCRDIEPLRHPEGIQKRVQEFERASEDCKGLPVETRLECMSEALRKRGTKWGIERPR